MNYIREINAFYDLVQVKQLSTGQIALWHALMHINNKCAWAEWFTAPNLTLELISGLSRKGIYNARNSLKQHGIIDFKSNGTKATSYKLISMLNNTQGSTQDTTQDKKALQDITQGTTQSITQDTTQGTTQDSATLNKLNETKLNDINTSITTEPEENIFGEEFKELAKLYQQVIGQPNAFTADWIITLKSEYGFEWAKNAMLESERQGKRSKKYVEGILRNWKIGGGMKLSTDNKSDMNKSAVKSASKKTRFHNFDQRTDQYTGEEINRRIEDIGTRKRKEYLARIAKQGGSSNGFKPN